MVKVFREDRDHRNRRTKEWHRNNPERGYWLAAKSRAKRQGVPFNLEPSDIFFPEKCPVLGINLCLGEKGIRKDCTPSLDKIHPEKGYIKGNVRVISWRANRLKNDATLEELQKLVEYMKNGTE